MQGPFLERTCSFPGAGVEQDTKRHGVEWELFEWRSRMSVRGFCQGILVLLKCKMLRILCLEGVKNFETGPRIWVFGRVLPEFFIQVIQSCMLFRSEFSEYEVVQF